MNKFVACICVMAGYWILMACLMEVPIIRFVILGAFAFLLICGGFISLLKGLFDKHE